MSQCMADAINRNVRIMGESGGRVGKYPSGSGFKPYREHAMSYRNCIEGKKRTDKILSI